MEREPRVAQIGKAEPNPGKVPAVDKSNGNLPDPSSPQGARRE